MASARSARRWKSQSVISVTLDWAHFRLCWLMARSASLGVPTYMFTRRELTLRDLGGPHPLYFHAS